MGKFSFLPPSKGTLRTTWHNPRWSRYPALFGQRRPAGSRRNSFRPVVRSRRRGAWVPLRDRRSLRWRRLRSPRSRRLRRFVAPRRPFGGIAFLRRLRTRHRRLAALQPAPTPPAFSCGRCASRRVLRAGPGRPSRIPTAQSPLGLGELALGAPLAHSWLAKPVPCGLPESSTGDGGRSGGASAARRPRLKVLLAALRSTLRCRCWTSASLRVGRFYGSARVGVRVARPAT